MSVIFNDNFSSINQYIAKNSIDKIFFLADENTHELCLPPLLSLLDNVKNYEVVEIPAGESSKCVEILYQVWMSLSEMGADRNSLLINCGGGVVTDLGGFVAATYKRGIRFINIPTSLLSMVDASVGGKTGIDLGSLKNQVGTFSDAEIVNICPHFLATLPANELCSGFAEMLKHALIADEKQWNALSKIEKLSPETVAPFLEDSIKVKAKVVAQDPTEKGLRRILNAGHTIGHAVESFYMDSKNPIMHGKAVALGLIIESHLAMQKGLLSKDELTQLTSVIKKWYAPIEIPSAKTLEELMKHDKKNQNNEIKFVLLSKIGLCKETLYSCSTEEIEKAIDFYTDNPLS